MTNPYIKKEFWSRNYKTANNGDLYEILLCFFCRIKDENIYNESSLFIKNIKELFNTPKPENKPEKKTEDGIKTEIRNKKIFGTVVDKLFEKNLSGVNEEDGFKICLIWCFLIEDGKDKYKFSDRGVYNVALECSKKIKKNKEVGKSIDITKMLVTGGIKHNGSQIKTDLFAPSSSKTLKTFDKTFDYEDSLKISAKFGKKYQVSSANMSKIIPKIIDIVKKINNNCEELMQSVFESLDIKTNSEIGDSIRDTKKDIYINYFKDVETGTDVIFETVDSLLKKEKTIGTIDTDQGRKDIILHVIKNKETGIIEEVVYNIIGHKSKTGGYNFKITPRNSFGLTPTLLNKIKEHNKDKMLKFIKTSQNTQKEIREKLIDLFFLGDVNEDTRKTLAVPNAFASDDNFYYKDSFNKFLNYLIENIDIKDVFTFASSYKSDKTSVRFVFRVSLDETKIQLEALNSIVRQST